MIQGDPRLRYAYPYFRMHLEEIRACIECGCSVRSVWCAYATRAADPFPGSYSSFLRYCGDHGLGRLNLFPPPLERPPGFTPEQIDRMMDADRDLDPKR